MYRVTMTSSGWVGAPGFAQHFFQSIADPTLTSQEGATRVATQVQLAYGGAAQLWPAAWTGQVSSTVDVINEATGALVSSLSATGQNPVTGQNGNTFGPLPAGICVNLNTGDVVNGTRVRGRTFLVPLANVVEADGTLTTTQIGLANTWGDALRQTNNTNERLVIWHRPIAGAGGSAHACTGRSVRDKFAILRSRRD